MVADSLNFNSQPLPIKAWALYEKPARDGSRWSGDKGNWYDNSGLFNHIEGPDHSEYWTIDDSTHAIIPLRYGYWYIENVVGGLGDQTIMAGIFTKDNLEICTGVATARTSTNCTAFTHYLYRLTDSYNVGDVGWRLKAAHTGSVSLGRHLTYANIFYLGPM